MLVLLEVSKREVCFCLLRNKFCYEGKVLVVVYGYKIESIFILFDGLILSKLLCEYGVNIVIMMDIDG